MSLLLDALKAAENLKRSAGSDGGAASRDATADDNHVGELSLAEDPPAGAPAGKSKPASVARSATATVQQLHATEPPQLRTRSAQTKSKLPLLGALLLAVVMVLGGAWWYLLPDEAPTGLIPMSLPAPSLPPAPPPVETPGVVTQYTLAPATQDSQPAQQAAPRARPPLPAARDAAAAAASSGATVSPQPTAVVVHSRASPLLAAYAAFQAGDLPQAQRLYEETLVGEPHQSDAHLGLAVMAQARGDNRAAFGHYREVVNAQPDHARAWAGIADLAGDGELDQMESRLRGLVAGRPTAALHFALGNILMRQSRWPEAQESYFAASSSAPDNADYVFNLAVALDHIGKGASARHHYEKAIALAGNSRAVRFDLDAAQQRLAALRQVSP